MDDCHFPVGFRVSQVGLWCSAELLCYHCGADQIFRKFGTLDNFRPFPYTNIYLYIIYVYIYISIYVSYVSQCFLKIEVDLAQDFPRITIHLLSGWRKVSKRIVGHFSGIDSLLIRPRFFQSSVLNNSYFHYFLVGALEHQFYFPINIGLLSSSQLTNSIIFQDGVAKNHQPDSYFHYEFQWHHGFAHLFNPQNCGSSFVGSKRLDFRFWESWGSTPSPLWLWLLLVLMVVLIHLKQFDP